MRGRHLKEFTPPTPANPYKPVLFRPDTNSASETCGHNIGATLGLCQYLLVSWIKTVKSITLPAGQVIYPTFEIILPGTKTKLFLKTAKDDQDWQLSIFDELMNHHYDPNHDKPDSRFPNVAGIIFTLLEYCFDGNLPRTVHSLEVGSTICELNDNNKIIEKTLHAITVTGRKNIIDFSSALNKAFAKCKGMTVPLEQHSALPLYRTRNP